MQPYQVTFAYTCAKESTIGVQYNNIQYLRIYSIHSMHYYECNETLFMGILFYESFFFPFRKVLTFKPKLSTARFAHKKILFRRK